MNEVEDYIIPPSDEEIEAILEAEKKKSRVYRSAEKKNVPVPDVPFERFITRFRTLRDVSQSKEWKESYCNYYSFTEDELNVNLKENKAEFEKYDHAKQREEFKKCINSFTYFCVKYARIAHPTFGIIPFMPYIYQKRSVGCYNDHRFNILRKFRQGGLTTVSVMWALWRCLFKTGQRIMVVSKTDREAIAAGEIVTNVIDYLPSWLIPTLDKFNEHEKQFKGTNSVLWFYTVEAARGKSITVLIIDEAAFIDKMDDHWKALFPVIATGGQCIVISTVNGRGNWYFEKYQEAEESGSFNIIELSYWEHPLYNNPTWVRDTKLVIGDSGWEQEVLGSFSSSENSWINMQLITDLDDSTKGIVPMRMAFENWKNIGTQRLYNWDKGALWIFKDQIPGREYIISADAAEGVGGKGDNSCFQVIDKTTVEQVAEFYSNTIPPHTFADILRQIGYHYNNALIVVESEKTGSSILATLHFDYNYDMLYCEENKNSSLGLKPTAKNRNACLQVFQQRIMTNAVKINSNRLIKELDTFKYNPRKKRPEAVKDKHDDAIMALAIGLYVRELEMRGVPVGADVPQEIIQKFRNESYDEIKREILGNNTNWRPTHEEDNDNSDDYGWKSQNEQERINSRNKYYKRHMDEFLREFGW